jgi:hypothetical protein
MPLQPRMRANHIQQNVESLELLGPDVARAVKADLGAEALERIEKATRVEWLPVEVDVAITEAVARTTGEAGVRKWSRAALAESVEAPFLRPIVKAAIALFGLTPASLLRHAPTGWKQVYLDCGVIRFESVNDKHVRLHLDGAPLQMTASKPYLVGTAGAWEAAFDIARAEGGVVDLTVPSPVAAVFDVTWR